MIRALVLTIAGAALAGGFASWLDFHGARTDAGREADAWSPAPERAPLDADALVARLMETRQFAGPPRPEASEAPPDPAATDASGFPKILASARLDGRIVVNLRLPDGTISLASVGDAVAGGWTIEAASLDRVTISRDSERKEVHVFPDHDANAEGEL